MAKCRNHPIKITASNPSDGDLTLTNRGNATTNPCDTVTWIPEKKSGVKSILRIYHKSSSQNVFDPLPAQLGNSKNWRGTIDPTLSADTEEDYNIEWVDEDGNTHIFDPKIQVHIRE